MRVSIARASHDDSKRVRLFIANHGFDVSALRLNMDLMSVRRPRLVALEGPAGVGKTTLTRAIADHLHASGSSVTILPEFQRDTLGDEIARESAFGIEDRPPWLSGLAGRLIYLSSHIQAFESVLLKSTDWIVADRFLLSDLVYLQLSKLDHARTNVARQAIMSTARWLEDRLDATSVIIQLLRDSRLQTLTLEQKHARPWSPSLERHVLNENSAFSENSGLLPWCTLPVKVVGTPSSQARELLRRLSNGW